MLIINSLRLSPLRSVFCLMRLHYSTPYGKKHSIGQRRLNYIYKPTAAQFSSDSSDIAVSQQFQIAPKENVDTTEVENKLSHQEHDHTLPSKQRSDYERYLVELLYLSDRADAVFDLYTRLIKPINANLEHLLIEQLKTLVITGKEKAKTIHSDEHFQNICRSFLEKSLHQNAGRLVGVLSSLLLLEVDENSKIVQVILQLLKEHINKFDIRLILKLDVIVSKFTPSSTLFGVIINALPLILENALKVHKLDDLNESKLIQLLTICVNNKIGSTGLVVQEMYIREKMLRRSPITIEYLLECGLLLSSLASQQSLFTENQWRSYLKLRRSYLIYVENNLDILTFAKIRKILWYSKSLSSPGNFSNFFYQKVTQHCIKNYRNITYLLQTLKVLYAVNIYSEELVDLLVSLILKNPDVYDNAYTLFTVHGITSIPNLQVEHFDALNIIVNRMSLENLKWHHHLQIALYLGSVGYYHEPLLKVIASCDSPDRFSQMYQKFGVSYSFMLLCLGLILETSKKTSLRFPEELLNWARKEIETYVKFPKSVLYTTLCKAYGGPDFVVSNVFTDNGLLIDHLLVMDDSYTPVEFSEKTKERFVKISDLNIPEHYKRVAVKEVQAHDTLNPKNIIKRNLSIHLNLLQSSGFTVIPIFTSKLDEVAYEKRVSYVINMIASYNT